MERDNKIARAIGLLMCLITVVSFCTSTWLVFNGTKSYHFTPAYQKTVPRELYMGTYVYDNENVANHPEYFDDIALMVDRVLVDISWRHVMLNDSYPTCFDIDKYAFYDQLFQNYSSRGLEIVIQFSPTRSPPQWLDVTLDMDGYRAENPPQDPVERARFIQMLLHYVNYTVNFFDTKPYFIGLEYCLADEPHTADWADVLQEMHDTIKASSNSTVSLVLHKPELYPLFFSSFDMITIDPYNDDVEMVNKIRKAHADVNESKEVRVIISGMHSNAFDYQRVYRQLIISWFMGAHDIWFWSYNSRWDGETNEWYVVLFSPDGPVHTERANAIINARQDLKVLAEIDNYLKTGTNHTIKKIVGNKQEIAYRYVMKNNFGAARRVLVEAHELMN
ncbi:hypothetical protein GF325_16300 [Candidatus Bathyarchaeota archaeon]|nr:hypothetical protein [Candidatus Bathyarchaeota archaeon]